MIKKLRPAFIAVFLSSAAGPVVAQVTNTTAEDFRVGMQLTFQACPADAVAIPPKAEREVWDFSGIRATAGKTTVEHMISPAQTVYSNMFPDATLAEQYSDGKLVFLKKTKESSYLLGYIDPASRMQAKYSMPVLIARRPLALGQQVTDSFTTAYTVQDMAFKGSGTVRISADGYGTLVLPNGTFKDVMLVTIRQQQEDLLAKYASMNTTLITTYVWFDNKHKSALLKVTEIKAGTYSDKSVEYLLEEKQPKAD